MNRGEVSLEHLVSSHTFLNHLMVMAAGEVEHKLNFMHSHPLPPLWRLL